MKQPQRDLSRFIRRALIVIAIIVIYAIGLQVTEIDLKKPQETRRQEQLTNILRGLAQPDLFAFETERVVVNTPILIPCVPPGPPVAQPSTSQPTLTLSTACAEPGQTITVSGSGFAPQDDIFLFFVPFTEDPEDEVELKLVDNVVPANRDGTFTIEARLRRDRVSDQPQIIRAVVNRRSGWPSPSEALLDTLDKITETVFLALIATTLGIVFAVPFSFLAARNLMFQVDSQFFNLMASLVAFFLGTYFIYSLSQLLYEQLSLNLALSGIQASWRSWGVTGNFLTIVTDLIYLSLPVVLALSGGWFLSSTANRGIERFTAHIPALTIKIISIVVSAVAGAILFAAIIAFLNWFYQFGQVPQVLYSPAVVGLIVFGLLGVLYSPERRIPSGIYIYYIVRTIMNVFRSIEPLVMVVAFAVWVGIGPFAGVMALMLHTVVALGKLYSEQVENIATGPIEAVTATGANRLQTIIYAVIPQIIPPYIAFTLYRWDINVRMSTIIGFGGGGGIGFLLAQNINLLRYRQASVNMLAIALVVATLDYVSAKVREKIM